MPTAYPTESDLHALLRSAGILTGTLTAAQAFLDLVGAAASAWQAWEKATRYEPFLAESADSTRYYDPEGELLFFRGGYVSVTSVTTGVTASSAGTVLTANQDYWLDPRSELPVKRLQFRYCPTGDPQSIKIIGKRGYQVTLDDLVFRAIRAKAAELLVPELRAAASKGLVKWKRGDEEKVFGEAGAFAAEEAAWCKMFDRAVLAGYKRI